MSSLPQITEGRTKYVPYELAPGRVDAVWNRLRDAERGGVRATSRLSGARLWVPAGGISLAMAAFAALWFSWSTSPEPSPWSGARLHAGNEAVRVALQDGSEIEAQPHASLELLTGSEKEVRVALRGGTGHFKVAKNQARNFFVEAGPVVVRVVGTRFRVERDDAKHSVHVDVQSGVVEVLANGEVRRLRAGESLHVPVSVEALSQRQPATVAPEQVEADAAPKKESMLVFTEEEVAAHEFEQEQLERKVAQSTRQPMAGREPAHDTVRRVTGRTRRPRHATSASGDRAQNTSSAPGDVALTEHPVNADEVPQTAARTLLEQAQRTSDRQLAARLLQELLEKHPEDARVPLAAFQLGRIRMDSLHDPRGAIEALRLSLRGANPLFREDAMARLVRSAELTDRSECSDYRRAYLADYPNGRYARDVSHRCPAKARASQAGPSEATSDSRD